MRLISYIKFLFTSTNAHGVHSPFVFDLVQKCFYAKEPHLKGRHSKKEQLLYRITKYFDPETIYVNGNVSETEVISQAHPATSALQQKIPFAYISHNKKTAALNVLEQLLPTISNNSVWIINHIHSSPEMEDAWIVIKNHPKVTVSIDTFTYGLVLFRSEQPKEHFIIRPNKSGLLDFVLGVPKLWGMLN